MLPNAPLLLICKVQLEIVVPPPYVLAPVNESVPVPAFVRPLVPEIRPLSVTEAPACTSNVPPPGPKVIVRLELVVVVTCKVPLLRVIAPEDAPRAASFA